MFLLKVYRPSALAAFALTTPLFGVVATALVLEEPITWTLGLSALLVAAGIAVTTIVPEPRRRTVPAQPEALP